MNYSRKYFGTANNRTKANYIKARILLNTSRIVPRYNPKPPYFPSLLVYHVT